MSPLLNPRVVMALRPHSQLLGEGGETENSLEIELAQIYRAQKI
jgi:hypothetical protein